MDPPPVTGCVADSQTTFKTQRQPASRDQVNYTPPKSAKLPRSASSPSPPSAKNASGRADSSRRPFLNVRSTKRRLSSFSADAARPDGSNVDLSSTYHAGSSRCDHLFHPLSKLTRQKKSDDSDEDTAGEDTDDGQHLDRGRCTSLKGLRKDVRDTVRKKKQQMSPSRRTLSPVFAEHVSEPRTNGTSGHSFARSRSPHVRTLNSSGQSPHQTTTTPMSHARHRTPLTSRALLPGEISLHVPIPFSGTFWTFSADSRSLAESLLLLGSLFYANRKLALASTPLHAPVPSVSSGKLSRL